MLDEKEIAMALNELQAISDQKQEILAEFGKKYAQLDSDIRALESKKKQLEGETKTISDIREEAVAIIKQAKFQESEILKAAEVEKIQLLDKAKTEAAQIIDDANKIKASHVAILAEVNSKVDGALEKERKANEYLRSSEKILMDAEYKGSEANKLQEKAIKDQVFADKRLAEADVKLKALKAFNEELLAMDKAIKEERAKIESDKVLISDMRKSLDIDVAKFREQMDTELANINAEKELIKDRLNKVKEQEENNAWRSKELDIGYELLKNKQSSLDRDIKRLEGLKKELSK